MKFLVENTVWEVVHYVGPDGFETESGACYAILNEYSEFQAFT